MILQFDMPGSRMFYFLRLYYKICCNRLLRSISFMAFHKVALILHSLARINRYVKRALRKKIGLSYGTFMSRLFVNGRSHRKMY